jgi:hypothetical protein
MAWAKPSKSSSARGYGAKHRKLRAALLPAAYGQPCVRCGELMHPWQQLHLDHSDWDRSRLIGFSHADCNREAGARKAKAVRRYGKRVKTTAKPVHRW